LFLLLLLLLVIVVVALFRYVQLHRDTSLASLTVLPQLDGGRISWQDSPLVRALREGTVCVVVRAVRLCGAGVQRACAPRASSLVPAVNTRVRAASLVRI